MIAEKTVRGGIKRASCSRSKIYASVTKLAALFVYRGDDWAYWNAEIDEHGFRKLQGAFQGLWHSGGRSTPVEFGCVDGIAGPRDYRQVRITLAEFLDSALREDGLVHRKDNR